MLFSIPFLMDTVTDRQTMVFRLVFGRHFLKLNKMSLSLWGKTIDNSCLPKSSLQLKIGKLVSTTLSLTVSQNLKTFPDSHKFSGDIHKCYSMILYNEMCQYLEDMPNLVNQYFQNDTHKLLQWVTSSIKLQNKPMNFNVTV